MSYRKPTDKELIEAYDNVRRHAGEVARMMKDTVGGDHYAFTGSMNTVDDLRDAIEDVEGLLIVGAPTGLPRVIRCGNCDNGIDPRWCFCPWCNQTLERGYFHVMPDGPGRFVLVDDRDDQPAPVFETNEKAEAALEQRVTEAYAA